MCLLLLITVHYTHIMIAVTVITFNMIYTYADKDADSIYLMVYALGHGLNKDK